MGAEEYLLDQFTRHDCMKKPQNLTIAKGKTSA